MLNNLAFIILNTYKLVLSPHTGGACRFHPSCSEYSIEAFKTYSFFKATYLTFIRILKCNPFGPSGFDPVIKIQLGDTKGGINESV